MQLLGHSELVLACCSEVARENIWMLLWSGGY